MNKNGESIKNVFLVILTIELIINLVFDKLSDSGIYDMEDLYSMSVGLMIVTLVIFIITKIYYSVDNAISNKDKSRKGDK